MRQEISGRNLHQDFLDSLGDVPTVTAWRTRPYNSTPFIPPPSAKQAKGYLLPDFYSGATELSGRLSEGLLLRRLHVRVALYLRVSTSDQTTKNQRRELTAVAKRQGWTIVAVFEDAGISGAKGRTQRPGLDAMLKGVARKDFDMVAAFGFSK